MTPSDSDLPMFDEIVKFRVPGGHAVKLGDVMVDGQNVVAPCVWCGDVLVMPSEPPSS